jgi:zinc protease
LPIVKRDSLLNGLQLIVLEQRSTGTVSAHLRVNSGAVFDLAGKGGLADVTAGMLLRGGGGWNAKNVADTVEQLGLTVNVSAGWDSTDMVINGPADSLEAIFDLISRLVITPTFDQKELESFKAQRVTALKSEAGDDAEAARRKALDLVFGSHPFGRPARGTAETVSQITRQDLTYFHGRFYQANNAQLIVTGDASAEQVTRLARARLGAWKKGERVPPTFRPPESQTARRVLILDRPDTAPPRAVIAQVGVSRRAEDYLASLVMADVLARDNARVAAENPGTAIETKLEPRLLAGPLMVEIQSSPDKIASVVGSVIEAMGRLQTSEPSIEQVESAKSHILASMAERLRTTEGAAGVILDIESYGLGRDYLINFADRVNVVTPLDARRTAQNYLKPQSIVVVITGQASRLESELKKIGPVTVAR